MTNHLLQYYLKRNAFYKVSYSPMEYSPGLMWFHSFIYSYIFLIRLAYRHLDEHVVDTVKELWILNLQLMFDGSCGLDVSVYHKWAYVQPLVLSCSFSHLYIWSDWIDRVLECDKMTCCIFCSTLGISTTRTFKLPGN